MYMFYEVLLYSGTKNSIKVKKRQREQGGEEIWKRDLREGVSHGARSMYFIIFIVIFDILQIWMWT